MTICINCNAQNPNNNLFCQQCSSDLLLEGRYRALSQLGAGGFGATYEVSDQGTAKVLKVLRHNSDTAIRLFQREAKFLASNNQLGIPKAEHNSYFQFEPKNSQQPLHCFVMEKIEGVNLKEHIKQSGKPIKGDLGLRWLKEIIEILDRVHSQDIIHRDIKPQNIMLKPDGKLVLIDFGAVTDEGIVGEGTETATATSGTQTATHTAESTKIFSKGYDAPEQIEGKAIKQSDIYSLGRTFVYLLTAKEPNDPIMYDAYNDQINWRQYAQGVSRQFADLIDSMIQRKASQRPANTQVILQRLNQLNGNRSQSNNQVIQGEDIEVELNVSQQEASSGTSKSVSFPRYIYVNGKRQSETKTLTVQVPAGSQNRTRLRLQGQGNQGLNGGNSGNVYVSLLITNNQQKQKVKGNPLLLFGGFVGVVGILAGVFASLNSNNDSNNPAKTNQNISSSSCNVDFNGYVRSEPSSQAGKASVISVNTKSLSLTGTKTHGGWNQVNLPDGNNGWVHDKVVANQIPSECITQRVNDADYIKSQPVNNNPAPSNPQPTVSPEQYDNIPEEPPQNQNQTYVDAKHGGNLDACIQEVSRWQGVQEWTYESAKEFCLKKQP